MCYHRLRAAYVPALLQHLPPPEAAADGILLLYTSALQHLQPPEAAADGMQ